MFRGGVGLDAGLELGNLAWEVVGSLRLEGLVGAGVEVMYKNVANVIRDLWELGKVILIGGVEPGASEEDVLGQRQGACKRNCAGGACVWSA